MVDIFETQYEGKDLDPDKNFVKLDDDVNMLAKDPTLKHILIGAGWDDNAYNVDDKTRMDEDFVFYNNAEVIEGAVKHHGDSRTGAGEGDDECITIDLNALPFDIMQILIVVSLYKGFEREQALSMMRNVYVRVMNTETDEEILRYRMDADLKEADKVTAVLAAEINREGPKWHFKPVCDFDEGEISKIAEKRGLLIGAH